MQQQKICLSIENWNVVKSTDYALMHPMMDEMTQLPRQTQGIP